MCTGLLSLVLPMSLHSIFDTYYFVNFDNIRFILSVEAGKKSLEVVYNWQKSGQIRKESENSLKICLV